MSQESGNLVRMRGMYRFVERERFEAAAARFEARFEAERELACRRLFFDLLAFRADEREDGRGIVEQSCDTIAQAETLIRIFPEARFIHVVRDGRDASASRVAQTRGLAAPAHAYPGDRLVGGADRGDRGGRGRDSPERSC